MPAADRLLLQSREAGLRSSNCIVETKAAFRAVHREWYAFRPKHRARNLLSISRTRPVMNGGRQSGLGTIALRVR